PDPLALEDDPPALLPGDHVPPLLASRGAEMLRPLVPFPLDEPEAKPLELERREPFERERVRATRHTGLGARIHGVLARTEVYGTEPGSCGDCLDGRSGETTDVPLRVRVVETKRGFGSRPDESKNPCRHR